MSDRVRVQALGSFEDFEKLLRIQKAVWNHGDIDVTPVHQFAVSSRMGAILLGAFVGRELAGFVYSFPAVFRGKSCQHSHLLAVLPEFQGRGLGKALKWAQRQEAVKRGYRLITWTCDPPGTGGWCKGTRKAAKIAKGINKLSGLCVFARCTG